MDRIVGIKALTRISLGSLAFGMVLVLGLKLAMPQIVLPPIWQMILILPGGVLYALVIVVVLILIPRRIVVSRDRIVIEHSKKRLLECSSIRTSWLLVHGTNKVRLKLGYLDAGGRYRICRIGLTPTIDLQTLCDLLPVYPTIHDARTAKKTERWDARKSPNASVGNGKSNSATS